MPCPPPDLIPRHQPRASTHSLDVDAVDLEVRVGVRLGRVDDLLDSDGPEGLVCAALIVRVSLLALTNAEQTHLPSTAGRLLAPERRAAGHEAAAATTAAVVWVAVAYCQRCLSCYSLIIMVLLFWSGREEVVDEQTVNSSVANASRHLLLLERVRDAFRSPREVSQPGWIGLYRK